MNKLVNTWINILGSLSGAFIGCSISTYLFNNDDIFIQQHDILKQQHEEYIKLKEDYIKLNEEINKLNKLNQEVGLIRKYLW